MKASIVIRTYNEQQHLPGVLQAIKGQATSFPHETVIVDSGSTDRTREIAEEFGCRIVSISKEDFSFGRSLNMGCRAAQGECLVFVSGHCIPAQKDWLVRLIQPLGQDSIVYTYGRQVGNSSSRFSECQIFGKYFPAKSALPQEGFFCNNANAALLKQVWEGQPFDEDLTGLEDMHLSKLLVARGMKVGYVAEAPVYHLHDESWAQIRRRFEREAIALQHIMPEIHVSLTDFLRYFVSAVLLDCGSAMQANIFRRKAKEILLYRMMQFWGAYRGNHMHRKLSIARKEKYYYPR
jgi:rhamnosyltransferase